MGTVFKKQTTRAVPAGAEITPKGSKRVARWRVRGKLRTAPVTKGKDGNDRIVTESSTYFAKYRDSDGVVVMKPTACRDKQAAEQMLKKWERVVDQVKAGTLDRKSLDAAQQGAAPLEEHLKAYGDYLIAAEATAKYRKNTFRGIRRVAKECGFATPVQFTRDAVQGWLADRKNTEKMSASARNYYRQSVVSFANWCVTAKRLFSHDLNLIPKADQKADPRRPRRALTEEELKRVLAVATERPLLDARTVRRGKRKGQAVANLREATVLRLRAVGRERALIYKTLVLTGLRANELRTLDVGQLDFTSGRALLQLDAADEKNRDGNAIAIRDDLAADLQDWISDKLTALQSKARETGEPIPMRVSGGTLLFKVPSGLLRILNRDLKAAGIPKRDDRGRTVDVHAMRTTFGTMLSVTGTMPRTAQAAMRHSDIKLTMGVYTDPRLLDVRGAVERLPSLPLVATSRTVELEKKTGTCDSSVGVPNSVAPTVAPTQCNGVHSVTLSGTQGLSCGSRAERREGDEIAGSGNEKPSLAFPVSEGHDVERRRVELPTSSLRTNESPDQTPTKQGDHTPGQSGCTTGCTNPPISVPDQPPSALLAALLTVIQQLPPRDRETLTNALVSPVGTGSSTPPT
jgi:integrase